LHNIGATVVRSLFLVTVEGEQLRFVKFDGVDPGKMLTMIQSERKSSPDELAEEVIAALMEEKLYEKEARAMVKTWRSSWFGEEGTRLFYMLPRTVTDELLPLDINPLPDEVVRVMVGRLEIMRPEDESRVAAIVKQSVHDRAAAEQRRAADPQSETYSVPATILQLGRLAEQALVRIKTLSTDSETCREATLLLEQVRQL
jgi:hypothetical protein